MTIKMRVKHILQSAELLVKTVLANLELAHFEERRDKNNRCN